jgi:hypothetical protein
LHKGNRNRPAAVFLEGEDAAALGETENLQPRDIACPCDDGAGQDKDNCECQTHQTVHLFSGVGWNIPVPITIVLARRMARNAF